MQYRNRLNELRGDMSQKDFAESIGLTQQNYWKYENGKQPLKQDLIESICAKYGCSAEWIMGFDADDMNMLYGISEEPRGPSTNTIKPTYSYHVVPIVGDVAAGDPCEAIELIDDVLTVPEAFRETHPDARALRIHGESMNRLFPASTYVVYDPELEIRDGDVAVVYVNGDDATVKRVYFAGDTVVLHPESTMDEFLDRAINTKDPAAPPVTFAGRVIWSTWGDKEVKF